MTFLVLTYLVALGVVLAFFKGASMLSEDPQPGALREMRPARPLPSPPTGPEQLELLPASPRQPH